jgi:hypothetical protein
MNSFCYALKIIIEPRIIPNSNIIYLFSLYRTNKYTIKIITFLVIYI